MTNEQKLKNLLQQVLLASTGNRLDEDDLNGEEGTQRITDLLDWANLWFSEFELEADWQYLRENQAELATAVKDKDIVEITAPLFRKLVASEYRTINIWQDDAIVSSWVFSEPNLIGESFSDEIGNRVSIVGNKLVFSRPLLDYEDGGTIRADIIKHIPELSRTDTSAIDLIKPEKLLVLGIAKDQTLPDYVAGTISPSLVQRYQDLLEKAKAENSAGSVNPNLLREDYSRVRGVY